MKLSRRCSFDGIFHPIFCFFMLSMISVQSFDSKLSNFSNLQQPDTIKSMRDRPVEFDESLLDQELSFSDNYPV